MMESILFCGLTLWTLIITQIANINDDILLFGCLTLWTLTISQTDNNNDGIHFIWMSDIMDPHHFSDRQ